MERVRASEVEVAAGMEAQITSLLSVLRTMQSSAESSSTAVLEQQKMAGDLDAYAKRLTAQVRMMINNPEQKQWHFSAEVNASREELVRLRTDAENKAHMAFLQQSARLANVEASVWHVVLRAQSLESEFRPA